jgi:hypothetical protein
LLADVSFPILGVYFLRQHQLVVDVAGSQLTPRTAITATDSTAYAVWPTTASPAIALYAAIVAGGSQQAAVSPTAAGVDPNSAGGEYDWSAMLKMFPGVVQRSWFLLHRLTAFSSI